MGRCIGALAVLALIATVIVLLVWDGQWIVAILVVLAVCFTEVGYTDDDRKGKK